VLIHRLAGFTVAVAPATPDDEEARVRIAALLERAGARVAHARTGRVDAVVFAAPPPAGTPRARDVPVAVADRTGPAGDLVDALARALAARACTATVGSHRLEVRGHAAVLDGVLVPLSPVPLAVLRVLTRRPGHVVPHAALRRLVEDGTSHAVHMAVNRLRRGLGDPSLVENVRQRGYRLACPPA
jgi:DNA-binding response OmpR family regulator